MSENKANNEQNQRNLNVNPKDKIKIIDTPNKDIKPPKYMYVSKSADGEKGVNRLNKIAIDQINKKEK